MAIKRPNLDKQVHFMPFHLDGKVHDLSHLNAHKVEFSQPGAGSAPAQKFIFHVTYSLHCFAKDYEHLTDADRERLMYHARDESRPFCFQRYGLSTRLPEYIANLDKSMIFHAGYETFACCQGPDGDYFISFVAYRWEKKLRLHVRSAYPLDEPIGKVKKVNLYSIARCLLRGKPLPRQPR